MNGIQQMAEALAGGPFRPWKASERAVPAKAPKPARKPPYREGRKEGTGIKDKWLLAVFDRLLIGETFDRFSLAATLPVGISLSMRICHQLVRDGYAKEIRATHGPKPKKFRKVAQRPTGGPW